MDGSVAEVQPTPDLYFYKSEMHPLFPSFTNRLFQQALSMTRSQ
ncbi:hypothetical protein [Baaleninema simplex]|nr:hypothetical protein [Baaleninema simplex]